VEATVSNVLPGVAAPALDRERAGAPDAALRADQVAGRGAVVGDLGPFPAVGRDVDRGEAAGDDLRVGIEFDTPHVTVGG